MKRRVIILVLILKDTQSRLNLFLFCPEQIGAYMSALEPKTANE